MRPRPIPVVTQVGLRSVVSRTLLCTFESLRETCKYLCDALVQRLFFAPLRLCVKLQTETLSPIKPASIENSPLTSMQEGKNHKKPISTINV